MFLKNISEGDSQESIRIARFLAVGHFNMVSCNIVRRVPRILAPPVAGLSYREFDKVLVYP